MKGLLLTLCLGVSLLQTGFSQTTFTLGEGTQARFYIDEVLFGQDKTVVGTTSGVTGTFTFDPENPQATEIGPIEIDARALTTDDDRRNRQIQRRVLASDQEAFRFITFVPSGVTGLPESVAVGDTFSAEVTGALTIRGVTREETFALDLTRVAEDTLQGSGSTTIAYADYDLRIPSVPIVASVADEVVLELEFSAVAAP